MTTTKLSNLPPAEHLPEGAGRTLLAELDRLTEQHRQLQQENAADQPTTATAGPDHQAMLADQAHVADLTRAGKPVTNPTKHVDALNTKRETRAATIAHLAIAITAATRDLVQWIGDNAEAATEHQDARLADAYDELAAALAAVQPLRTTYDQAHAARKWLHTITSERRSHVSWNVPSSPKLARAWSDSTSRPRTVGVGSFD